MLTITKVSSGSHFADCITEAEQVQFQQKKPAKSAENVKKLRIFRKFSSIVSMFGPPFGVVLVNLLYDIALFLVIICPETVEWDLSFCQIFASDVFVVSKVGSL